MRRSAWIAIPLLAAVLATGCAGPGAGGIRRDRDDTFSPRADGRTGAAEGLDRLEADARFLDAFARELSDILLEASVLARRTSTDDAGQDDRYAFLMFRYQLCRSGMWAVADHYREDSPLPVSRRQRLRARLAGMRAMMQVTYADSQFVLLFYDHEDARAALNRAYPPAQMEAGLYNAMLKTVLDPENLDTRDAAWHFFECEREPDGEIGKAIASDPEIRDLADAVNRYHTFGEASLERLLAKRGVVFPVLENRLRRSLAAGALKAAGEAGLGGVRALGHFSLKALVPLTRSPFAHATEFTGDQHDLMRSLIRPGDILLTYSSGYLTSIFFPGVFKHGIVYIGDALQRETLGIRRGRRGASSRRDLIEAVGEGVIWNRFEHIVGAKVTLVAVLRPILTPSERQAYLQAVSGFLGRAYDLRFDFLCPKRLCCTEVLYHTLNGRGKVQFPMVMRFGLPTLSADDLLKYYLAAPGEAFDLVFLGAPDPAAGNHQGMVLTGGEAQARLRALLDSGL